MNRTRIKRKRIPEKKYGSSSDPMLPDTDSDLSGSDNDADHTIEQSAEQKFEKPGREEDPDKTGIDIQTDATDITA